MLLDGFSVLVGGGIMNPGSGSVQLVSPIDRSQKSKSVLISLIFLKVNLCFINVV